MWAGRALGLTVVAKRRGSGGRIMAAGAPCGPRPTPRGHLIAASGHEGARVNDKGSVEVPELPRSRAAPTRRGVGVVLAQSPIPGSPLCTPAA